jgi:hypothetical protein
MEFSFQCDFGLSFKVFCFNRRHHNRQSTHKMLSGRRLFSTMSNHLRKMRNCVVPLSSRSFIKVCHLIIIISSVVSFLFQIQSHFCVSYC